MSIYLYNAAINYAEAMKMSLQMGGACGWVRRIGWAFSMVGGRPVVVEEAVAVEVEPHVRAKRKQSLAMRRAVGLLEREGLVVRDGLVRRPRLSERKDA